MTRWLALAFALGLAACGRSTEESAAPAPPIATRPTENQTNAVSRERVQNGGTLTWPLDAMPVNFNYNHVDGAERTQSWITLAMMPTAFHFAPDGTPRWNRDLLASEPRVTAQPAQVVTYAINPRAMWSDGTPITWTDFYWQWRASSGTDKAYQVSSSSGYADIGSVARGRDDREVLVTFKRRYADWQAIFNPVYPASTNKSPSTFNEGWKKRPLATAGPFTLDQLDETAKTVTLVRNEQWWGEPAKLDRIVFRAMEPDAQIDALANGELDVMDIGPDANKFNRAKGIGHTELRVAAGPNFRHITFNGASERLEDVRVRRALAMAIDRSAIARAMLGPLGVEPQVLNNHIFMTNQAGYQNNAGELGTYDLPHAGRLLDEAGWTLESGIRTQRGRTLEITCVIPAGNSPSRQEAELVQNMLGRLGVKLTISPVPGRDFFEKYVTPGQFDFTIFSWYGTQFPITAWRSAYTMPRTGTNGQLLIEGNVARIGSEAIDRLFEDASRELDRSRAVTLANRIDTLIWEEVHSLTLYQRPEIWAVKKGLANFGAVGLADIVYQDIGWVK